MATTEGWIDVMYAAVDSAGRDAAPIRDHNPGWYAVFLVFMLVGSCLFLNLFVGVVCDSFEKMRKDNAGGDVLNTEGQKEWIKMAQIIMRLKPKQLTASAVPALQFVDGDAFDTFIGACILLNGVSLALPYFGMADDYALGVAVLGHCFSFVFFVEMVLKLAAFRGAYFSSNWNRFDCALVAVTLVGLFCRFALHTGQEKGANIPTSKARISVVFHSFRLMLRRAIISRSNLERGRLSLERARVERPRRSDVESPFSCPGSTRSANRRTTTTSSRRATRPGRPARGSWPSRPRP